MPKGDIVAYTKRVSQTLADEMGYELVEVSLDKEPAGMYLRVYVDTPTGITLNDCEAFHKRVQPLLEQLEYDFLEVCSPGLDRPLKTPEDFLRAAGEMVEVRLFKPEDGKKVHQGVLIGLCEGQIRLDTPEGEKAFSQKGAALVKRLLNMEGVEDVDLGE